MENNLFDKIGKHPMHSFLAIGGVIITSVFTKQFSENSWLLPLFSITAMSSGIILSQKLKSQSSILKNAFLMIGGSLLVNSLENQVNQPLTPLLFYAGEAMKFGAIYGMLHFLGNVTKINTQETSVIQPNKLKI